MPFSAADVFFYVEQCGVDRIEERWPAFGREALALVGLRSRDGRLTPAPRKISDKASH
jgi:hypothetical protein